MAFWLLKTEPDNYNFSDLMLDRRTVWDGVSNNLALKHLRQIKKGDKAFIYHTGEERRVVGIAAVASDAYPNPKEKEAKLVVVDLVPEEPLKKPVTLAEIKADSHFSGWDLLRLGRLSVMAVPPEHWRRILQLANAD